MRKGLTALIEATPGIELVASCEDLDGLLTTVTEQAVDVVMTDIRMPPTNTDEGIRAANRLRDTHPQIGVVVLSQHIEPEYVISFFAQGTEGRAYLLKENVYDPEQLVAAIEAVTSGRSLIDPKVTEALLHERIRMESSALRLLTVRELEVLGEMAQGFDNRGIAERVSLSVRGVERHINSIFSKLGLSGEEEVHRRVKAVLLYLSERT